MPYAKNRRSIRRRAYRARRNARVTRVATPARARRVYRRSMRRRTPTEFPSTTFVKLRAVQDLPLALTAGSGTYASYALNDVYDPYIGADTQHTSGYDAYAGMYHKSIVYGCKVRFTGTFTANDSAKVVIGMIPSDAAAEVPASTLDYADWLLESKTSTRREIPPWITPQPYPRFTLKRYYDVAKVQGVRTLDPHEYGAETGGSPSSKVRVFLVLACSDGTATCTAQCKVQLTYYVRWSAPRIAHNVAS